ncbi:MAG: sugar phosphate isomerase/epimerase family protein [Anaerolineae bacterium]
MMTSTRIKPSMCSIGWRDEPIQSAIEAVSQAGYVGIEVWQPHVQRHLEEGETLASLSALLEEHALAVPMLSGYYDLAERPEESLLDLERHAEQAEALQAPMLRMFTGGRSSTEALPATWDVVTKTLQQACHIANERGLGIALETHEGHLHDTTESTLRLLGSVARPNLFVNLDIYNLYAIGEDPVAALDQLRHHIRMIHLKNAIRQNKSRRLGIPLAKGDMPYAPFLHALAKSGYDGYASIEWFGPSPAEAAISELRYLQSVLGEQLARRAE